MVMVRVGEGFIEGLRTAANLTPPTSCRRLACSTHISLAFSLLHGYCVVYGMFLSRRLSLDVQVYYPHMSCCRSPRFTLTSKGPLNYMTEPFWTFHFSSKWFQIFQKVQSFSKHQCMPSSVWHTILRSSLHFNLQFNFRVCPRG